MAEGLHQDLLPAGVRSRIVKNINGLDMHILEAGYEEPGRECLVLLHGFPELAYSWRKIIAPLAEAGYHVVAPDQRGYGLTTGWDWHYDTDLSAFRFVNLVRDVMGLLNALDISHVKAVIGHDFGRLCGADGVVEVPGISVTPDRPGGVIMHTTNQPPDSFHCKAVKLACRTFHLARTSWEKFFASQYSHAAVQ